MTTKTVEEIAQEVAEECSEQFDSTSNHVDTLTPMIAEALTTYGDQRYAQGVEFVLSCAILRGDALISWLAFKAATPSNKISERGLEVAERLCRALVKR